MLDEKIVETAPRLTGLSTQKELVDHALRELVRRHKIAQIRALEGEVDWDGDLSKMRAGRGLCEF